LCCTCIPAGCMLPAAASTLSRRTAPHPNRPQTQQEKAHLDDAEDDIDHRQQHHDLEQAAKGHEAEAHAVAHAVAAEEGHAHAVAADQRGRDDGGVVAVHAGAGAGGGAAACTTVGAGRGDDGEPGSAGAFAAVGAAAIPLQSAVCSKGLLAGASAGATGDVAHALRRHGHPFRHTSVTAASGTPERNGASWRATRPLPAPLLHLETTQRPMHRQWAGQGQGLACVESVLGSLATGPNTPKPALCGTHGAARGAERREENPELLTRPPERAAMASSGATAEPSSRAEASRPAMATCLTLSACCCSSELFATTLTTQARRAVAREGRICGPEARDTRESCIL
jgi:hypothetical protein